MGRFRILYSRGAALAAAISLLAGCGDSRVSDLASSVKDSVSQGVDKVKGSASDAADSVQEATVDLQGTVGEALRLAGKLEVTLDGPIQTDACYARWVDACRGRPAVLQLKSYRSPDQESFPSVFVNARVSDEALSGLVGQTIAVEMYVQPAADGAVWRTQADLVQLKIDSFDEDVLSGEFVGGSLSSTADGTSHTATGVFEAVLP